MENDAHRYHGKQKKIRFFRRLAMVVLLVSLFLMGQTYFQSFWHRMQRDELKEMAKTELAQNAAENSLAQEIVGVAAKVGKAAVDSKKTEGMVLVPGEAGNTVPASEEAGNTVPASGEAENAVSASGGAEKAAAASGEERVMLVKCARLYHVNPDLVGWLSIAGMKIDYPVMQSEDDEYYLHHDFYGNDSKYGCLYVRERADLEGGTNFIIYGHNMKDGSMFGDLDLYLDEDFYKEHAVISFDTLYEERVYEIVAVFRSQVYSEEEDAFMYYRFYEADTREEFADFYDNIKALSLYDTGVEAQFGDSFLTLSTCAYHVKDGRFVVVAKRVQ